MTAQSILKEVQPAHTAIAQLMRSVRRKYRHATGMALAYAAMLASMQIKGDASEIDAAFKAMLKELGGGSTKRFNQDGRRTILLARKAIAAALSAERAMVNDSTNHSVASAATMGDGNGFSQ